MTTQFKTRNLTQEESATLVRQLYLVLGKQSLVDAALRVIYELGLGIFGAQPADGEEK